MCTVSMIGEHYIEKWVPAYPQVGWPIIPTTPTVPDWPDTRTAPGTPAPVGEIRIDLSSVSRAEFEELQRDVQEMKELLKRAKRYDEEHDQPDCENDEKMAILRKVAEALGIDLEGVI